MKLSCIFFLIASFNQYESEAFSIPSTYNIRTTKDLFAFAPSKVTDDDGPTPEVSKVMPQTVSEDDIPEFKFDKNKVPIPHQPWRRGMTDGCEAPIDAPWRVEGEEIIRVAVAGVGAQVHDITWYMGAVVVTLSESHKWNVDGPTGPEVRVMENKDPVWFDENDPEPEDDYGIYEDEEDGRIETVDEDGNISSGIPNDPYLEREFDEATGTYLPPPKRPTRAEAVRGMTYNEFIDEESNGMTVQFVDRDERISKFKLSMEEFQTKLEEFAQESQLTLEELEARAVHLRARYLKSEDLAQYYPDEFQKVGMEEAVEKLAMPNIERADGIDTDALSTIGCAIFDALSDEDVEERLEILSRHEVILTSPGDEQHYVETQRQFDNMRGRFVHVQTQDPFGSNRVLKGHLIDRNALDVYINVKGRMVTIPLNFVAYVAIPREDGSILVPPS